MNITEGIEVTNLSNVTKGINITKGSLITNISKGIKILIKHLNTKKPSIISNITNIFASKNLLSAYSLTGIIKAQKTGGMEE